MITYQDLIGYRIPLSFPSAGRHAGYVATSRLLLTAVQKIIAYSRMPRPRSRPNSASLSRKINVVPLGVEPELFRERLPLDPVIRTALRLPRAIFSAWPAIIRTRT